MEFKARAGPLAQQRGPCTVVGVFESRHLSEAAKQLDEASGGYISKLLRRGDMAGEAGQTLMLYDLQGVQSERVLLVGCGPVNTFDDQTYRKVSAAAATALHKSAVTEAVSFLSTLAVKDRDLAWHICQAVTSTDDALYTFDETKSEKKETKRPLKRLALMVPERKDIAAGEAAIGEGLAIAAGTALAKDLGNLPANICTPTYLAEQAKALKRTSRKLKIQIVSETQMEALGMGALLSVSRGSEQPAKLITLEYRGGPANAKPIVLVGKGITFDTGGISIKPSEAMDEMKFDMCGAASVLGTLKACTQMELPVNVVGIVASAENMPSGRASKPGDVVTTLSGQTVEILNTDAEGRLVLCDALTYAERFEPEVVIDIATLTGACIIALGHHPSGLLSNAQPLAEDLLKAGQTSGDRVWQLPLWEDYQEQLKSNFADMANIGGRPAGTITAACFLARFTKHYRWAHLDIAGTAWRTGKEKGATGRPVPLLTHYLRDEANHKSKVKGRKSSVKS